MLSVSADTIRIFLHVLAATIWVGGQLILAALVPALRSYEGAAKSAARRFNMVAWPAYGVLFATGVWNILAVDNDDSAYKTTLNIKLAIVALSGLAAFLHMQATTKKGMAIWGSVTGVTALAALFFGVML